MIPGLEPIRDTPSLAIGQCLGWAFRDPQWVRKLLVGTLLSAASFLIIPLPLVLGYGARTTRAPFGDDLLPEWTNPLALYRDGLTVALIWGIHWVPLGGAWWGLSRLDVWPDGAPGDQPGFFLLLALILLPTLLAFALYVNTAILRAVVLRRFAAAFESGEIADFLRRNSRNVARFLVLMVPLTWLGQLTACLCGVGLLFGAFWTMCTFYYALGQLGRYDRYLGNEVAGAG